MRGTCTFFKKIKQVDMTPPMSIPVSVCSMGGPKRFQLLKRLRLRDSETESADEISTRAVRPRNSRKLSASQSWQDGGGRRKLTEGAKG